MARAGAPAAAAGTGPGAAAGGGGAAGAAAEELSLEEVLKAYEQPVNEEQAWAVCFQCCRGLLQPDPPGAEEGRRRRRGPAGRLRDTADLRLHKDGAVSARGEFGQAGEWGGGARGIARRGPLSPGTGSPSGTPAPPKEVWARSRKDTEGTGAGESWLGRSGRSRSAPCTCGVPDAVSSQRVA